MKAMPTEQSGLGLIGTPSDEILGKARDPMEMSSTLAQDVYEIHPRKGRDGFDRLAIASGGDQSVCVPLESAVAHDTTGCGVQQPVKSTHIA